MRILLIALLVTGCAATPATPSIEGRGVIVFMPATYSCAGSTKMSWAATLTDPVDGLEVTEVFAQRLPNGTEVSLFAGPMAVSNPAFDYLSVTEADVATFCVDPYGPGEYVVRLVRPSDSKILAEGTFTIGR